MGLPTPARPERTSKHRCLASINRPLCLQCADQAKTGGTTAQVYDVSPKSNRPGLIFGQLWIDSDTGREVLLSGFMTDLPGITGRLDFVRNTVPLDGSGYARVTHVNFVIPLLGKAEIAISEVPQPAELPAQGIER